MQAAFGATSLLSQPTRSVSSSKQTLAVDVFANQPIVAIATDGERRAEYWVRCLPPDFPTVEWDRHAAAGALSPGYYLVGNHLADLPPGIASYAIILDGNGAPVWYLRAPTSFGMSNVESPAPGFVAYFQSPYPGLGSFKLRDLKASAPTTVAPGQQLAAHELRLLPNGHYLAFTTPLTSGIDSTGLTAELPDGGTQALGANSTIDDCEVVEFTAAGTTVWSWLASDHFDPGKASTYAVVSFGVDADEEVDVFHCNSIDVDPANGNLLISARHMNSVFYVDRATGQVAWKMGGPDSSKDGARYVSVADAFSQQHDARLLAGWNENCGGGTGQVSLFDDESLGPAPARGVIYDVVVGAGDAGALGCEGDAAADGAAPGTAARAWQYQGTVSSGAMGSFRISQGGSRVIGWGIAAGPTFTEVDSEGHDLLDFTFGDDNPSYRAIKVPTSTFDLDVLRATAGSP